jgi:hypothetical protein
LDASVTIQRTIQQYRDTFFSPPDPITNPRGIGERARLISNNAQFSPGPKGGPYYENYDEYVVREPSFQLADAEEIERVQGIILEDSPEALEAKAQQTLKRFGVDATSRSNSALLLGAGAFTARRFFGAFGYRQAGGSLSPESVAAAQTVANLGS